MYLQIAINIFDEERQVHTTCVRLASIEYIYDQFSCASKPVFCSTTILESCLSVSIIIMSHRLQTWAPKDLVGQICFRISMVDSVIVKRCFFIKERVR